MRVQPIEDRVKNISESVTFGNLEEPKIQDKLSPGRYCSLSVLQ